MNNDNLPEITRTMDGDNRMTRRQFSSTNTRASDSCENSGTNHPNEMDINTRTDSSGTLVGKCVSSLVTLAESFFPLFFGDNKPDSTSSKTTNMSTNTRQEPDGGYSNVPQVQPSVDQRPAPCGAESVLVDTTNVFHQPQLNIGLPQPMQDNLNSPLETDGPQGELPSAGSELKSHSGSTLSEFSPSITPSASSNSVSSSNGEMKDFVVLHTNNDLEKAQEFVEHICTDAGDHITVDLFCEIDAGQSKLRSLGSLHYRYRYILIFVTTFLLDDDHCKYLNEILITLGLEDEDNKKERVVPVFASNGDCKMMELKILGGLDYYRRNSKTHISYKRQLNNVIREARIKFPVNKKCMVRF